MVMSECIALPGHTGDITAMKLCMEFNLFFTPSSLWLTKIHKSFVFQFFKLDFQFHTTSVMRVLQNNYVLCPMS